MRILYSLVLLTVLLNETLAEGCRELAPTGSTTALYVGKSTQGNFATFNDVSASNSRLNVRILNPANESIHLGFSGAHPPLGDIFADLTFRFYIKDPNNNIVYRSEIIENSERLSSLELAQKGPSVLSPDGYDAITIGPSVLTSNGWSEKGDYYIEFENMNHNVPFSIKFWDITVTSNNGAALVEEKGRLWSKNWVLFMTDLGPNDLYTIPFEGSFYVVAQDDEQEDVGYIHYLDFEGSDMQGAAFGIAFNNFGSQNQLSDAENRRSVFGAATRFGQYPIFLNNPEALFDAPVIGHARFIGTQGCLPNYCLLIEPTSVGEIEILIDLAGDNLEYDPDTEDVLLVHSVDLSEINSEICVYWDGINGLGKLHDGDDNDMVNIKLMFGQGVFHLPLYDVESNLRGFNIQSIQPPGPPPLIYYDDSDIPFNSGTMSPNINLDGCVAPCHTWIGSFFGLNYGNENTINSWWYSDRSEHFEVIELRYEKYSNETQVICRGDSFLFQDSLLFSAGQYDFIYMSKAGCDSVHTVDIELIDFEAIINTDITNLTCANPTATLDGFSSMPYQQIDYIWNGPDGLSLEGNTNAKIEVVNSGLYSLMIIEQTKGCVDRDEILLTEDFLYPNIDIVQIPIYKCKAQKKTIEIAVASSAYDPVINWMTEDGILDDVTNPLAPEIITTGTYEVTVSFLENGCKSKEKILIKRDTSSYLDISLNAELTAEYCSELQLGAGINSEDVLSYRWTPDTLLSCRDCLDPIFNAVGEYDYTLTARDTNNCRAYASVLVELNEDYKLYIPNAFSPNNDGINDQFKMYSSACAVPVEEFAVVNRWGDRVFRRTNFLSTDQDVFWDGMVNGEVAAPGVYAFYASLKIHNGETIVLDGDVQLVK